MSWTIESSWYSHESEGLKPDWALGHIHKYEAAFGYFVDIWTAVTFWSVIFILTYKVGINYAPIINRINYLSENILSLKHNNIVTGQYIKSLRTKKR